MQVVSSAKTAALTYTGRRDQRQYRHAASGRQPGQHPVRPFASGTIGDPAIATAINGVKNATGLSVSSAAPTSRVNSTQYGSVPSSPAWR